MARNKYPEETVNRILDVAMELFTKNGYDNTSIQDIVDHLGGLSKGAIYHHFKGKDDILVAATTRADAIQDEKLRALREDKSLTGRQKLMALINISLHDESQGKMMEAAPNLTDNPKILVTMLKNSLLDTAPHYIQPMIEEGNRDGSLNVTHPKQAAEAMLLLTNIWLSPVVYPGSGEDVAQRVQVFLTLMQSMGMDIIDEESISRLMEYQRLYDARHTPETKA